jgi:hypothetical protein
VGTRAETRFGTVDVEEDDGGAIEDAREARRERDGGGGGDDDDGVGARERERWGGFL